MKFVHFDKNENCCDGVVTENSIPYAFLKAFSAGVPNLAKNGTSRSQNHSAIKHWKILKLQNGSLKITIYTNKLHLKIQVCHFVFPEQLHKFTKSNVKNITYLEHCGYFQKRNGSGRYFFLCSSVTTAFFRIHFILCRCKALLGGL